jgi:Na+/H+ antiporter NhaA
MLAAAKVGILVASVLAGVVGWRLLVSANSVGGEATTPGPG